MNPSIPPCFVTVLRYGTHGDRYMAFHTTWQISASATCCYPRPTSGGALVAHAHLLNKSAPPGLLLRRPGAGAVRRPCALELETGVSSSCTCQVQDNDTPVAGSPRALTKWMMPAAGLPSRYTLCKIIIRVTHDYNELALHALLCIVVCTRVLAHDCSSGTV